MMMMMMLMMMMIYDDDDDDGDGGDDDDGVGDGDDGDDELSSVPRDVGYMKGYEKYGYEQEHHQDHHHHHHHHYLSHQNRVVIHVGYPVITSASFVFIASPVVINVDLLRFIAIYSIIPGIMIAFLTVIKLSIIRTIVTVICPFIFYIGNNITMALWHAVSDSRSLWLSAQEVSWLHRLWAG